MYWLDTVILVLLALGAILGAVRGLLWQVAGLVSCGLGLYCAVAFHEALTPLLTDLIFQEAPEFLARILTWLLLFLAVCLLTFLLALGLDRLIKKVKLQWLNRLLGAGMGAVKAALLLGVIFLALQQHAEVKTRPVLERSAFALPLTEGVQGLFSFLPGEWTRPRSLSLPPS